MKLYRAKFGLISSEILDNLIRKELVEVSSELREEAELDIQGVLREYSRMSREINQRARDEAAGSGSQVEGRIRRRLAKEKNFRLGDDALGYVVNQIIETVLQSNNFEEIFGEDRELRAVITPIVRRNTQDRREEMDREVRSKLKNLEAGSTAFDIEYEKTMERVKRLRGISEE